MRAPATFPDEPEPEPQGVFKRLGIRVIVDPALPPDTALFLDCVRRDAADDPLRRAVIVTGIGA